MINSFYSHCWYLFLQENLPRVLPKGVVAEIEISWPIPPIFQWLIKVGSIAIPYCCVLTLL